MKFTWIGGPTWLLELGAFRILGDPVFADRLTVPAGASTRTVPLPDIDLSTIDAICVSCLRPDHCSGAVGDRVDSATPAFVPDGCRAQAREAGLDAAEALAWYGQSTFEKAAERLVVTAVPAMSKSGDDNGYFLEHVAGDARVTAYCTGDALWSNEVRRIQRELGHSNILIQHLGAERDGSGELTSSNGKDAIQFVYRMQPNAIAAVHHSTFSHYNESLDPFRDLVSRTIYDRRLRSLSEGESFDK